MASVPSEEEEVAAQNQQQQTEITNVGELHFASSRIKELHDAIATVVHGKSDVIRDFLTAIVAGGSVLLEDLPGVGKTTLAKTFANLVDLRFQRLQCTPDLMPSDVSGFSVYDSREGTFTFRPGPIFSNVLLIDEINRASPRTQSALLEAMAEGQVTIEGKCRQLERPFLVIATQNPTGFKGTYPLPEAQLDRFLFLLEMNYPDRESEIEMLYGDEPTNDMQPILDGKGLEAIQLMAANVEVHRDLADYIIWITQLTRKDTRLRIGCSPRGSKMLFRAAQAAALVAGRDFVLPDDVQHVAPLALAHRVSSKRDRMEAHCSKRQVIEDLVSQIPVPA
ncbi:MAG: MoxR family ATPase [Planctomycetales bacterium]|nr:MoxR family ATPase [Planctomycetales bacterium]